MRVGQFRIGFAVEFLDIIGCNRQRLGCDSEVNLVQVENVVISGSQRTLGNAVSSHIFAIFAAECSALDIFPAVALCKSGNRVSQLCISFAVDLALLRSNGNSKLFGFYLAFSIDSNGVGTVEFDEITGIQTVQTCKCRSFHIGNISTVKKSACPTECNFNAINGKLDNGIFNLVAAVILLGIDGTGVIVRVQVNFNNILHTIHCTDVCR